MASEFDDILIVQRGNISGGGGNDTFILSGSTIEAGEQITISDASGANRIQLIDGLSITGSLVASNAVKLTLSNGAEVTLLSADNFTYEIGGNPFIGDTGTDQSFQAFVSNILESTVPTGSTTNSGGQVTVDETNAGEEPVNTGLEQSITGEGSSDASAGDVTFSVAAGTYVHSISNFAPGDVLDFVPSINTPTIQNTSGTDGTLDLIVTSADSNAPDAMTIKLTGLSTEADSIHNYDAFLSVFGAGTVL